ncbi:kinase phosphorylation protein-domain-containing protein [Gloeopeniophorella convolvens]|nr:kinase phosphorylation protein-domain-containing protein [Gloeopeniophorella convolvens]
MFEPIRGGTRGGQGEFKWSDVSADKDRENYLGHSVNAPTGRWQKNKDVHWYNRDVKGSAEQRAEELRKIKEAEAEALSIALGFGPSKKEGTSSVPGTGANAVPVPPAAADPDGDPSAATDEAERKQRKAERKEEKAVRKAERAARKEQRRVRKDRHYDASRSPSHPRSRSRSPVRWKRDSRSISPRRQDELNNPEYDGPHNRRHHDSRDHGRLSSGRMWEGDERRYHADSRYRGRSRSRSPWQRDHEQRHASPLHRASRDDDYDDTTRERERVRDRRRWDGNVGREVLGSGQRGPS